jgi:hypothetical protein
VWHKGPGRELVVRNTVGRTGAGQGKTQAAFNINPSLAAKGKYRGCIEHCNQVQPWCWVARRNVQPASEHSNEDHITSVQVYALEPLKE